MRPIACATIAIAGFLSCGCSNPIQGSPSAEGMSPSNTQEVRQTDAQGTPLPFHNTFSKRWNSANDGTSYEPCTVGADRLVSLGIDPDSARDAATVDGQTLRGCDWDYFPPKSEFLSIYQIVGNSESLDWYKVQNRIGSNWLPDEVINGRRVGVASDKSGGCLTYVQSGTAGVVTGSGYGLLPSLPEKEICGYALDLTRATIDKIPE
nr:DUF3558 family protein [Gordonia insulae]